MRSAQGISRWLSGIAAARLIQLNHLTTAGVAGSSLPVIGAIHIRSGGNRVDSSLLLTRNYPPTAWGPGNSSPEIRFLFLTARPWAERGSCSARDLLVVVVVVVFFLSVARPKPPLGQIVIVSLNHATCDVYSPKAVETLMYGKCYGYCFLYCVYFLLVFSKRWTRS